MKRIPFLLIALFPILTLSQQVHVPTDTTLVELSLSEVEVVGFESNRELLRTAGAINVLDNKDVTRFDNTSIQPAINSLPGVKMESRGPGGSRRISIRGSMLRSPFGVRNIKAYWNDIPLTSPDGSTPLELIDVSSVDGIEVIKGPAGSLYGAGNGGVLLFSNHTAPLNEQVIGSSLIVGSNGLFRFSEHIASGTNKSSVRLTYTNQSYDGYRDQEFNRKDHWDLKIHSRQSDKQSFDIMAVYFDGFWGLPGAIDSADFADQPTMAVPFAVSTNTMVDRKRTRIGLSHTYHFSDKWKNTTSLYGNTTDKVNPYGTSAFFNGYKFEHATGGGGRTKFIYSRNIGSVQSKFTFGAEYQRENNALREFTIFETQPGLMKINANTISSSGLVFAQGEFEMPFKTILSASGSLNYLNYDHRDNLTDNVDFSGNHTFPISVYPRVAVSQPIGKNVAVHASLSSGYSAPTVWEVLRQDGSINTDLNPELGTQYEAGFRTELLGSKLFIDIVGYQLQLSNAIVPSTLASGETVYQNTGSTAQNGVEGMIVYRQPWEKLTLNMWTSITYQSFAFDSYVKNGDDHSGNLLPGVPEALSNAGIDLELARGLYLTTTYNYVGRTPLNDSNSDFFEPYHLLASKLGYRTTFFQRLETDIFGGVNNALDSKYSSFLQLNGFGGRFYNPSPARNFYGGLIVRYKF